MRPVLWWGDLKVPRLGCLWMEGTFTLAEPRLDQGTMARVYWLVWLGMPNILAKVMLGALDVHISRTSWEHWRGGTLPLPRDWHLLKVSFGRCPHGGYGAEYRGYPRST
ncbi:unnamed protein product [Prunus armeniaca]